MEASADAVGAGRYEEVAGREGGEPASCGHDADGDQVGRLGARHPAPAASPVDQQLALARGRMESAAAVDRSGASTRR